MKLSSLIAGAFGIMGFVISVLAGLLADNTMEGILLKGLLSSAICYAVGYVVGWIAQQVSSEHAIRIAQKVAEIDAQDERKRLEEAAEKESELAGANAAQVPTNAQIAPAKA